MGGSKHYAASTTSSSASGSVDSSDLQSWCEVPSIAHFCSLFRQAFDLLEFDIQELEESLLLMNSEDDSLQLVQRLVIKLLKGCSNTYSKNITTDNFNTYLRRLFLSKREDAEEDNLQFHFDCKDLLDNDIDFQDLSLRNRVRILHQLCEYRLDAEDVFEKLKNLEASSLRVEPLGKDAEGITYWYFYGTRLYKEEFPKGDEKSKRKKEKERKKKKKDKKSKKKKKKKGEVHSASSDEEEGDTEKSTWSVACLTLKDWEDLTEKYKKSKKKAEKELYETLSDGFLPEIVKMFAEKEREERRRLLLLAPKRASSRIERKKQEQEEKDRIEAERMEEARRLEEEYDEKLRIERQKQEEEERERAREERIKIREQMKEAKILKQVERESRRESRYNDKYETFDSESEFDKLMDPNYSANNKKVVESEDESKDSDYSPSSSNDGRPSKSSSRTNFTNALLKAGTKSTKDSSLDKPVRKGPGLLLEAAGRSLLNKAGGGSTHNYKSGGSSILSGGATSGGLSFGLVSSKISFGLYGGHLPVDHGSYTKSKDGDSSPTSESSNNSRTKVSEEAGNNKRDIKSSETLPRQKVFSNWGGEFFKKNLDYRANTNKILEKMNLNSKTSNGDTSNNSASSSSAPANSGTGFKSLASSAAGNSKRSALEPAAGNSNNSPAKKLKTTSSSFLNSYS